MQVPPRLFPFVLLVRMQQWMISSGVNPHILFVQLFIQLLMPDASFLGHLAGIAVGFFCAYFIKWEGD